jgi:hypothetical protein
MASRKPIGKTKNQKPRLEVDPSKWPELLIRSPKTKLALWWSSGTKTSNAMTTPTPSTCQPTDTLLKNARKLSAKMLTSV